MDRKLIGYCTSFFGLGVITSAVIYPMGYLESEEVFKIMTLTGNFFIFLGLVIRSIEKKSKNTK